LSFPTKASITPNHGASESIVVSCKHVLAWGPAAFYFVIVAGIVEHAHSARLPVGPGE